MAGFCTAALYLPAAATAAPAVPLASALEMAGAARSLSGCLPSPSRWRCRHRWRAEQPGPYHGQVAKRPQQKPGEELTRAAGHCVHRSAIGHRLQWAAFGREGAGGGCWRVSASSRISQPVAQTARGSTRPHIWDSCSHAARDLRVPEPWSGFVRRADLCDLLARGATFQLPPIRSAYSTGTSGNRRMITLRDGRYIEMTRIVRQAGMGEFRSDHLRSATGSCSPWRLPGST